MRPFASASHFAGDNRRIWFLNRYFWPDISATSQLASDLAFRLARQGWEVGAIAANGLYNDRAARLPNRETTRGVHIHRVAAAPMRRGGLAARAIQCAGLHLALASALARHARFGDVVVVKTDPPMLGVTVAAVARARGLIQVNWLQDLYPEVAIGLGVRGLTGLRPFLTFLRDWSLRGAVNIAVGESMADRIRRSGIARAAYIPNWCNETAFSPSRTEIDALRDAYGVSGKFVLGYSGNLGRSHEFTTLVDAAERLRERDDLAFLFTGGGALIDELKREIVSRNLEQLFRFASYQPAERLAASLAASDAHWVSLRPEMEGLIVPSKFYAAAAAGRPIVAVAAPDGEIGRQVRRHGCGFAVAPGDGAALAAALSALADNPAMRAEMGERARTMVTHEFPREAALRAWTLQLEAAVEVRQARATVPKTAPAATFN